MSKNSSDRLYDWGSVLSRGRSVSLHNHVQTSSVVHSAFYPMGVMGSFMWGKMGRA